MVSVARELVVAVDAIGRQLRSVLRKLVTSWSSVIVTSLSLEVVASLRSLVSLLVTSLSSVVRQLFTSLDAVGR